ncbi:Calx-beta domain-containing protein [Paludisphaera mucosa]|uniref:Calx-beta domain-containing protein n=1 Tax=Paludisphaera mucosa TaxID=3030827 RepID=A0ABT6FIV1_9BACT|nr:Calx-beta domain-containing protein [Paludisphaera mucosa]MDG3007507.1 Calx-beta domain-containing protein [Paludisphaera mucosa]
MMLTHGRQRRPVARTWSLEALEDRRLMSVTDPAPSEIAFPPNSYHEVSEAAGSAPLTVVRTGDLSGPASVHVQTRSASAQVGYDYVGLDFVLGFAPGQSEATFDLVILDDDLSEPLYKGIEILLDRPEGVDGLGFSSTALVGLVDDEPGSAQPLTFLDFGDAGLWTYNDAEGYRKINDASPEAILTTSQRGALLDFGPAGLWAWDALRGYRQLSDVDPEAMLSLPQGNPPIPQVWGPGPTGSYTDTTLIDFGHGGLWTWSEADGYRKINDASPEAMAGSGYSAFLDFGPAGLWAWDRPFGRYEKINDASPEAMAGLDTPSPSGSFDFGASGLWQWNASGAWRKLSDSDPVAMTAGTPGHTYINFGPGGLWDHQWDGTWLKLGDAAPETILASQDDLYLGYGAGGLWRRAGDGTWTRLNDASPEASVMGDDLLLDYGRFGLWRWKTTDGFRKLNDADVAAIAIA